MRGYTPSSDREVNSQSCSPKKQEIMKQKVIVAMSGGVDSSVAAALLKEQGYAVEGIFMKNWSPDTIQSLTDCPWEQDLVDAEAVCKVLDIPFRSVNFEREYKEKVVDYFLAEYAAGRTPNPDIMCNKEIKFRVFLDQAKELGADYIATGHYVRKVDGKLWRGTGAKKDQSYFLYTLDDEQLSRSLFPVGDLPKSEVRRLAEQYALPTATKKDSQGICFIGHIDLKKFLMEQISAKSGSVYLLAEGETLKERMERATIMGKHHGSMFYTVGERMGAVVDNRLYAILTGRTDVPTTYLVIADAKRNRLYVTDQHDDKHLWTRGVYLDGYISTGRGTVEDMQLTVDVLQDRGLSCQIRYQQKPVPVDTILVEGGRIKVETAEPVWAAAAGQSLVLYEGDAVVGGGVICAIAH